MKRDSQDRPEDRVAQLLAELMGQSVAGKNPSYPPLAIDTDLNEYKLPDTSFEYMENEIYKEKNEHEAAYIIIGYAFHHQQEIFEIEKRLKAPIFRGIPMYSFIFKEMKNEMEEFGKVNPNKIRDKILENFKRHPKTSQTIDIKAYVDMMRRKPTRKLLEEAIELINQAQ